MKMRWTWTLLAALGLTLGWLAGCDNIDRPPTDPFLRAREGVGTDATRSVVKEMNKENLEAFYNFLIETRRTLVMNTNEIVSLKDADSTEFNARRMQFRDQTGDQDRKMAAQKEMMALGRKHYPNDHPAPHMLIAIDLLDLEKEHCMRVLFLNEKRDPSYDDKTVAELNLVRELLDKYQDEGGQPIKSGEGP
jgi:hypothetical protein